jgi:hypothetical protein
MHGVLAKRRCQFGCRLACEVVEHTRLSELAHVEARQAAFPDGKRRGAAGRHRAGDNLDAPGAPSGRGPV